MAFHLQLDLLAQLTNSMDVSAGDTFPYHMNLWCDERYIKSTSYGSGGSTSREYAGHINLLKWHAMETNDAGNTGIDKLRT